MIKCVEHLCEMIFKGNVMNFLNNYSSINYHDYIMTITFFFFLSRSPKIKISNEICGGVYTWKHLGNQRWNLDNRYQIISIIIWRTWSLMIKFPNISRSFCLYFLPPSLLQFFLHVHVSIYHLWRTKKILRMNKMFY